MSGFQHIDDDETNWAVGCRMLVRNPGFTAVAPDVIGKSITIDGQPFAIVGVLPESFYFLFSDSAIFMPRPGPIR